MASARPPRGGPRCDGRRSGGAFASSFRIDPAPILTTCCASRVVPNDRDVPGASIVEVTADDAEIARLAALPVLEYQRERKDAARKLGTQVGTLDHLVGRARPSSDDGEDARETQRE